jgi:hypothetical protein
LLLTPGLLINNLDGHIFPLFIIIVAAAEAAVGLAIVIRFFQIRESIHIDDATQLTKLGKEERLWIIQSLILRPLCSFPF